MNIKLKKKSKKRLSKIFIAMLIITCFSTFNVGIIFSSDIFSSGSASNDVLKTTEGVNDNITKSAKETYNLDEYVETINNSVNQNLGQEIDFKNIANELLNKNNINYKNIFTKLIEIFASELSSAIRGAITIFVIVIIMAILSNLELDNRSDITRIAHLACFIVISTITVTTFVQTISMIKSTITTIGTLIQVISPFLLAVLIATGKISSTGIIQPLLLFLASSVGFIVTYFVIPLLSISVAFNVICSISENIKLEKLSKLFSNISLWTIGVVLTFFLGVLSLETSLSSSVDSLSIKTTQAAVSNFVPVVGKFFSDSFEVVVGATKLIGNTGGIIGILGIIVVAIVPIFKIFSVMMIYMLLSALVEMITTDPLISKYLSGFANVYKTLLGVLIGVVILFVISTGIILNLVNSIIV